MTTPTTPATDVKRYEYDADNEHMTPELFGKVEMVLASAYDALKASAADTLAALNVAIAEGGKHKAAFDALAAENERLRGELAIISNGHNELRLQNNDAQSALAQILVLITGREGVCPSTTLVHLVKLLVAKLDAATAEVGRLRTLLERWTNAAGKAEQESGFTTTELHHCWTDSMSSLAPSPTNSDGVDSEVEGK